MELAMLFWVLAAAMTVLASLAVFAPLARPPRGGPLDQRNDLRVYRDQLAEVDRDLARGAIRADDAEQARAEIGRRIVRVADRSAEPTHRASGGAFRAVAVVAVLSVPVISWALYGVLGSPDLPSQPLEARLNKPPSENTPEELVARAEAHLAKNPSDGQGWDVLAPTYLRLGRPADAITAYRNAMRLLGENAERLTGLAEGLSMTNGGIVSAEAEANLKRALEIQPKFPKAAFLLALGLAQEGRTAEATAAWKAILSDPQLDPSWREIAEAALQRAARAQDKVPDAQAGVSPQPGPTQGDIAAAQEMTPQDRAKMIETMVASLDERLRANPNDLEGWIRLVRSYVVLGKPDAAKAAVKRAIQALGNGSDAAKRIANFAAEQGVSVTE